MTNNLKPLRPFDDDQALLALVWVFVDSLRKGYPRGLPIAEAHAVLREEYEMRDFEVEAMVQLLAVRRFVELRDGKIYYLPSRKQN